MLVTRRLVTAGLAAGIASPALIRSAGAQGATVKIGMVTPMTGAAAESGSFAQTGAKIALEQVNKAGGVLGKPLELVMEDDQTTNPGAVLAFSKLASQPDIVAFLGSIRSTQNHAMAPDMLKIGKPVGFGGTDPNLTKLGNPWLFRFRPNDAYSGKVIAQYGGKELGKKKWAIVHSTDAFGTAGAKALAESLPENEVRKVAPDNQSSWTYDAVVVLAMAMNKAGTTEPGKVRQALLAIRGHKGAEGEYNFDKNGDGLHGYNIVKNEKGDIKFDKRIDFTPNLG
jgi:branched-chain amino acid transport system substrate-binding protein